MVRERMRGSNQRTGDGDERSNISSRQIASRASRRGGGNQEIGGGNHSQAPRAARERGRANSLLHHAADVELHRRAARADVRAAGTAKISELRGSARAGEIDGA